MRAMQQNEQKLTYKTDKQPKRKKAATGKLVGVKWCKIHKEWLIKSLINPKGTKLNIVINNEKKYIFFTAHFN